MSDGLLTTQDISLTSCMITGSSGQKLDFKNLVVEFNYFEDLFGCGISGILMINDSMGYINILQLQGSEVLTIKLDKPGLELPIYGNYRIYTVSDRKQTNHTNQNYLLKFCSEELFLNEQYRFSKAYSKMTISDMISDIALNQMRIPQDKLYLDSTSGIRDIVVPNMKPLQAINWLSSFALADGAKNIGAPYLFYEDRDGWKFHSILNLFKQNVYKTYQYNIKGTKSDDNPTVTDLNSEIVNVLKYEHVKNFDSVTASKTGVYHNKLHTVDPLRLKFGETEFNYNQYKQNAPASLNDHGMNPSAKNRFGDTLTDTSSVVKFCITTTGQSENSYIKDKKIAVSENLVEQTVPLRNAQLSLFYINRMKIMIPGDVYMAVGRVIEFNLPQISYNKESRQKSADEFYSGKYLVTAVRHMLNQEGIFITALEICKESSPTEINDFNNSDPEWSSLR
jgi:hypothetical protein